MRNYTLLLISLICLFCACSGDQGSSSDMDKPFSGSTNGLFKSHKTSHTGIDFINEVENSTQFNPIINDGLLQGGGIGIINIDNDDLPDIVVIGNYTGIRLYRNKGNFTFEDVTVAAKLTNTDGWNMGVTVVDIDGDNDDDFYVTRNLLEDRSNLLFINNGDNTFTEKSDEFGIADTGFSVMSYFFDYDRDGDLDLYLLNQPPSSIIEKRKLKGLADFKYTNKLYSNTGGKFEDVTATANLVGYNYSLSALPFDYNDDGYIDIFVANDFDEPDQFFINQKDGTFRNVADILFRHLSTFSMGSDLADINNDGLQDIFVADMVAEDNFRQKTNMSGMNPEKFWKLANNGYHYQYMFNAMHLNNGNNSFSEIAQLSGIANTDWSWSTLFMDMNLDGYKDLLVTNGLFQDIRNKDFESWRNKKIDSLKTATNSKVLNPEFILELANQIPKQKIRNYFYKNNGDLTFTNKSEDWGFTEAGITQGAAYADFDNDGDLDFVVNHMNKPVEIFESTAADRKMGNYINIKLKGAGVITKAYNSKVSIEYGDDIMQSAVTFPTRGYISSNQNITQFGLGPHKTIDKLTVTFLSGKVVEMKNVKANQTITIDENNATSPTNESVQIASLLKQMPAQFQIKHTENDYDDYKSEILIPYKMSSLGPAIAIGDVNGDNISDMYIGGATGIAANIILGTSTGSFTQGEVAAFKGDRKAEDGDALFFDADGDSDLDLYVCSGSNEVKEGSSQLKDRLYINDGNGRFTKSQQLPDHRNSTHTVAAHDIDGDGDQDLFVGGRQVPGRYGVSTSSYIYLNNGKGQFTEVKQDILSALGMVTDAVFVNIDKDEEAELVVSGEWMPISIFDVDDTGILSPQSGNLSESNGLWNTIKAADLDGDGDTDLIAGNLGLNNKYKASKDRPFKVFVDDFDDNGSNDVYLGYYANDGVCYPVRGRQCSSEQMPFVKKKFETYEAFATASIIEVLDDKLEEESVAKEAYTFAHTMFLNDGNGNFKSVVLPNDAQRSIVNDILVTNLDNDPENEVFLVGNYYDREVETTRSDAGIGTILNIDSDGQCSVVPSTQMGQFANLDAREVVELEFPNKKVIAVANNNDVMQFFELNQ